MTRRKATKTAAVPPGKATVHLSFQGVRPAAPLRATVRTRARRMLVAIGLQAPELSIVLCNDSFIQQLNREYRGKDKSTDVLAFPMGVHEKTTGSLLLGDVVISLPTARLQARRRGHPLIEEVTFLLAHGMLHLLGMDHRDRQEEQAMMTYTYALWAAAQGLRARVDNTPGGN